MSYALVWFRRDLRLSDNPALQCALRNGYAPIPVYIHAPEEEGQWAAGAASLAWLHRSLVSLDSALRKVGSRLIIRSGPSQATLAALVQQLKACAIFWNRRYEPFARERDRKIKLFFRENGITVQSFNASLFAEPGSILTRQETPYRVFTPFWRETSALVGSPNCISAPSLLPEVPEDVESEDVLKKHGAVSWGTGFWEHWQPGELGADRALRQFILGALQGYKKGRDFPDRLGSSHLSPHVHFGEISVKQIAKAIASLKKPTLHDDAAAYVRQLGWREFAYYLLFHFPDTPTQNLYSKFDTFAWRSPSTTELDAWKYGNTGVPIVDAAMRALWKTGWMHNRVRMIVASYLCKHLRAHWHIGARWFWDTLVDADLACNTLGWQWVAGTGADAAPYFRIFNPVLQAQRFDPKATFITQWVPELAALPVEQRFAPWLYPSQLQHFAPKYPVFPIVDLDQGRRDALDAYKNL